MRILILLIMSLLVAIAANGASENNLTKEERIAAEKAAKIISFFDSSDGAKAWPGFHFSSSATIIHFDGPPFVAFDLKNASPIWEPVLGLGRQAEISERDLWGLSHTSSVVLNIEGQPTYIFNFGSIDKIKDEEFGTFLHERFHDFQFETFQNLSNTVFLDQFNTKQIALTLLEDQVLLKSIASPTLESLKDIVSVHRARARLLKQESLDWERWQQRIEGTADYIETRTFTLLPILDPKTPLLQMEDQAKKLFTYRGLVDSSIKWRHYPVGNILGFLLDRVGPKDWKEQVAKGLGPMDVAETLIKVSDIESDKRLVILQKDFDFNSFQSQAETEITKYRNELDAINKKYAEDTGYQVRFVLGPNARCRGGGGSTERTYFLADGSDLSLDANGIWQCESKVSKGRVELKSMPFTYPDGFLPRFKINRRASVILDGKTVQMSAGDRWDYSFKNLQVNGEYLSVLISGRGGLFFSGEEIVIHID